MSKLWVGARTLGTEGGIDENDLRDAFEKYGKLVKVGWRAAPLPAALRAASRARESS